LAWVGYFVLHSLLAAPAIKKLFPAKAYRLIYVLVSLAGLLALLVFTTNSEAPYLFLSEGPVRYISLLLTTVGVMVIQLAFREYSLKSFIGLREEEAELKTSGILAHIRHPIYAGTLLIALGLFLFIPKWPVAVACTSIVLYTLIGIQLEERKLVRLFGQAYTDYQRKVPMLIPGL